jgi:uncharacterized protein YndB with AHSA1/START domain
MRSSIRGVELTTLSGPVAARVEIDIAAPQREVWRVLADINGWASWNPAVREATIGDAMEAGRRFRYATALGNMRGRLRVVDAPERLVWSARLLTMGHQQAFVLAANDDGCHVVGEATLSGPGAWLFKSRLDERLRDDLDAQLRLLRLEAETRVADETAGQAPTGFEA